MEAIPHARSGQRAKKRVFSGIQPSGRLHVGNYLGAIRSWVENQAQFDNIFCIVDLHAITVPQSPAALKASTRESAAILLAAGIDPEISVLFIQSRIAAHAELAWILNCLIPMGWIQRMTQFKEKSALLKEQVSVGLFDYPALMAADILLYETDLVPVGEDQKQHLEFCRDAAKRFNNLFGQTFKMPEPLIPGTGARIMGLDDPLQKMSKSEARQGHALYLLDDEDTLRRKIMRATTDSLREIRFDEKRPGIHNLLVIYERFTAMDRQAIEARFAGKGYGDFKKELAEVVVEGFRPIRSRYLALKAEPGYVDRLLERGAGKIMPVAQKTLAGVKEKVGLG